jgi:iron complex outermembrane receptor protein
MRHLFLLGVASAALIPSVVLAQQVPASMTANPQDIIVTASPFGSDRDQTPTIAAKVDRETILQNGGASIADALAQVPGISATTFAAGASRPIIRGMDATRVRILEDGSSSSDVSDIGPDQGIPIDPLSAQSIEVVRGAGTLRYGSQAIGGVVNALNNRVPMSLPDKPLSGEIDGSFDTVSNTGQGSLLADGRVGDLAVHIDGFYRHAEDYDTPLGTQPNSFFHGYGETVGTSYFFGPSKTSHIGIAIMDYDAQYGIPSDTTYIDMHQTKVLTRDSFDLGSGLFRKLTFDGSYAKYQHTENEPDGTVDSTFRNREYDGHAELLLGPLGFLQNTALGAEVQHRKFSALGEDSSYLFPTLTKSEAGYIFTETPITSALKVQASGRVEHVSVQGTPRSNLPTKDDFTPLSASLGALLDVGKAVKLGLNFSSTGRAPAQTELFARGGHDGPDTFETGDANLKIERANSLEGTIRVKTGAFRFEGSVYSTWFHNYIYGELTGRTCDDDGDCVVGDGEDLKELNYRQQGAHFRGVEGQASYALFKTPSGGTLEAKAIGDFTRATLDQGGNVPRIPPYRLGGGLAWESSPLDAGFLFTYYGRQDKFGAFDTATPSYVELNANIAWRPLRDHPGVELAIVGHNLTNDVQRNAAALNKDEVVLPGRDVRFVLKLAM